MPDPGRKGHVVRTDPAYLEFFGFGSATPDELRAVAQIKD
jgi:hypothetical protein